MPMEGAVASVVNGTSVVVVAGADKESLGGLRGGFGALLLSGSSGPRSSEGAAGGSPGAGEAQGNEAPAASETPAGEWGARPILPREHA